MKKKIKRVSILVLSLGIILNIPMLSFGKTLQQKMGDTYKTWTIKFNKDLDINNIKNNIIVEDIKGNVINSTIETSKNLVRVKPPLDGYKPGEYIIKISNKIKSTTGSKIKEGYEMKFIVEDSIKEENTEIVDSYNKLLSVVEKKVKNFKIVDKSIEEVYNKANEIINSKISSNMTECEKEKILHDYVVKNTEYDYDNYLNDTIPSESYTPYGVLIKKTGVCSGYAKTMKLLLNMVDIECEIISGKGNGGGHAWNKVKIDGKKYNLDATWDDPVPDNGPDYVRYKYFNISDDELSKDHDWDIEIELDGEKHTFSYRYYKFCKENNIKLGITKKLSSKISLPDGEKAPKGGVNVHICIEDAKDSMGDIVYEEDLYIPEGENSVKFPKDMLQNKDGYMIKYYLYFSEKPKYNYVSKGYYTTDQVFPQIIDLNTSNNYIANIEIQKANLIKGKVSLPNGELAPKGGIEVGLFTRSCYFLSVEKHGGMLYAANSQYVTIPEGKNYVEYSIPAVANSYGYYIDYSVQSKEYEGCEHYYKEDGGNIAKLYVNKGDAEANITISKNE